VATRLIHIKIAPHRIPELEHAAASDRYSRTISYTDGIAYLEDADSDVFSNVQDFCMKHQLPHDLSYHSDGEIAQRHWLHYRPDTPSGITTRSITEPFPSDIKPLAEC